MSDKATSKDRFLKEKRTKMNKDNIEKGPKVSVRPDERGPEKNKKLRVINIKKIDQFGKIYRNEDLKGVGKTAPKLTKFKPITIDRDRSGKLFQVEKKAKGGRAGFKMGSKCKLATKGKGRAYGKNS